MESRYTGYFIRNGHIYGPDGDTHCWIGNGHIYEIGSGPSEFLIRDGHIYHVNEQDTGYFTRWDRIYGPQPTLPWLRPSIAA